MNAGHVEGGHLAERPCGGLDERQGTERAAPLAEAQAQVDEREEAQVAEHHDDLAVTTGSRGVERDGVEGRLDLLQASLSTCPLVTGRGEMRPGGQFGKGDGADGGLVGKRRSDGGVIPIDDHGGVEQADGHLQALIDDAIEVGPELAEVNMRAGSSESNEARPRDESASGRRNRTELGHGNAIARHDEGFPGGHRVDHPGIVVAQLPLRDGLGHTYTCST